MNQKISVSKEYLDTINDWLSEWSTRKDSWIIPQFLTEYGIGWSYFKAMIEMCPQLKNTFETTVSVLCSKWLFYGMNKKNLPAHMTKILMKYLRVYDNHAHAVDQEAKKELYKDSRICVKDYATEDYSKERLKGLYKSLYDGNVNKRRGRESS